MFPYELFFLLISQNFILHVPVNKIRRQIVPLYDSVEKFFTHLGNVGFLLCDLFQVFKLLLLFSLILFFLLLHKLIVKLLLFLLCVSLRIFLSPNLFKLSDLFLLSQALFLLFQKLSLQNGLVLLPHHFCCSFVQRPLIRLVLDSSVV